MPDKKSLSDQQWKEKLTPEQYEICRNKGTESPFSGEYLNTKTTGTYIVCAAEMPYFIPKKNLIPAPAGQVSGIRLMFRA